MSRLIEGLESIKVLFDTKAKQSENAGYWKDFAGIIADAISTITEKTQRIENMETMIEDMEERIAIMTEGGWISVEERLPDAGKACYVAYYYHHPYAGEGYAVYQGFAGLSGDGAWVDTNGVEISPYAGDVTHWQYANIPEPPKEGEA